jgi:WD40 repeat protein
METNAIQRQLSGHDGAIYDACWDQYRGEWLTAGGDGVVAAWGKTDEEHGRAIFQSKQAFYSVTPMKSGPIAGTEAGELMMIDSEKKPRKIVAHNKGIFSLSPIDENRFLCGGGDGRITEWDALTQKGEWHWKRASKIRVISPSHEGTLIGSSTGDGIIIPELTSGINLEKAIPISGHEGGTYAAIFLAQKAVWLTGGRDGHLRVWSKDGEALIAIPAHDAAIYRIVQSKGIIYTASRDKTIKSWNERDLTFRSKWDRSNQGAKRSVNALCIGGEQPKYMLAAGDDRIIRVIQL